MFRTFYKNWTFLKKHATINYNKKKFVNQFPTLCTYVPKCRNVLISSQIYNLIKENKENIEDILHTVQIGGEEAYIELIDVLKEFMLETCKNYRTCVIKQIEIIKAAENLGPLSDKWDDLPEYRTLAKDFNYELNIYLTLFKSVGEIVKNCDSSNVQFNKQYKQLEEKLNIELEENKKVDKLLLETNFESILKDF